MVQSVKGDVRGITHRHLNSLRRLALGTQSGGKLLFPGHLEARREFDWLIIAPEVKGEAPLKVETLGYKDTMSLRADDQAAESDASVPESTSEDDANKDQAGEEPISAQP